VSGRKRDAEGTDKDRIRMRKSEEGEWTETGEYPMREDSEENQQASGRRPATFEMGNEV